MSYSYNAETIDQRKFYKSYNGQCIEGCPEETKEKMNKDGIWICEVNLKNTTAKTVEMGIPNIGEQ